MKKQSSAILALVIGLFLTFIMPIAAQADPPASGTEWGYAVSDVDAEGVVAHDDDTYTLLGCGTSTGNQSTFSTIIGNTEVSSGPPAIVPNSNQSFRCVSVDKDTRTVYGNAYDDTKTDSKNRFVAIRNGRILWSVPLDFNDSCSALYSWDPVKVGGKVTNVTVDSNGLIHTLITGTYFYCNQYYVTYDASGNEVSQADLGKQVNQYATHSGKIFNYDSETIVVSHNFKAHYFDTTHTEVASKQYQMPVNTSQPYFVVDIYANPSGRVYLTTQQNVGCYASNQQSPVFWHDTDGTSGSLNLSFGCTAFSEWSTSLGAGNDIFFTSSTGTLKIPDMSGGTNHVDHTFSIDSGYTSQKIVKYWVNVNGDGLMVRWIRNTSTGANDFVVDLVDNGTFALTRLKSFKAIVGGAPVYTGSMGMDITNDGTTLYGVVCQTGLYCNPVDRWAYKMPVVGFTGPVDTVATNHMSPDTRLQYVAMGDSFSSGEGVEPYIDLTDSPFGATVDLNECHRSNSAYPGLLANESTLNLNLVDFVACSGATTGGVRNGSQTGGVGQLNEYAQINSLTDETDIVTATIGGNDAGFEEYLFGCQSYCGPGSVVYDAVMDHISSTAFKANLKDAYLEIVERAPNAQVYIGDYPNLSDYDEGFCNTFDFSGVRLIQNALNHVISEAVAEVRVGNTNLHMVKTNNNGSPFADRGVCSTHSSYFNGFTLPKEHSFHPNSAGQAALSDIFKSNM